MQLLSLLGLATAQDLPFTLNLKGANTEISGSQIYVDYEFDVTEDRGRLLKWTITESESSLANPLGEGEQVVGGDDGSVRVFRDAEMSLDNDKKYWVHLTMDNTGYEPLAINFTIEDQYGYVWQDDREYIGGNAVKYVRPGLICRDCSGMISPLDGEPLDKPSVFLEWEVMFDNNDLWETPDNIEDAMPVYLTWKVIELTDIEGHGGHEPNIRGKGGFQVRDMDPHVELIWQSDDPNALSNEGCTTFNNECWFLEAEMKGRWDNNTYMWRRHPTCTGGGCDYYLDWTTHPTTHPPTGAPTPPELLWTFDVESIKYENIVAVQNSTGAFISFEWHYDSSATNYAEEPPADLSFDWAIMDADATIYASGTENVTTENVTTADTDVHTLVALNTLDTGDQPIQGSRFYSISKFAYVTMSGEQEMAQFGDAQGFGVESPKPTSAPTLAPTSRHYALYPFGKAEDDADIGFNWEYINPAIPTSLTFDWELWENFGIVNAEQLGNGTVDADGEVGGEVIGYNGPARDGSKTFTLKILSHEDGVDHEIPSEEFHLETNPPTHAPTPLSPEDIIAINVTSWENDAYGIDILFDYQFKNTLASLVNMRWAITTAEVFDGTEAVIQGMEQVADNDVHTVVALRNLNVDVDPGRRRVEVLENLVNGMTVESVRRLETANLFLHTFVSTDFVPGIEAMTPNLPVAFEVTNGLRFYSGKCRIGPETGLQISFFMDKAFRAALDVYWEVWQVAPGWWSDPNNPKLHDIMKANDTYRTTGDSGTEEIVAVQLPNDPSWIDFNNNGQHPDLFGGGFQFFIRQYAYGYEHTLICNTDYPDCDSYVALPDMTTPYPTSSPTTSWPTEFPVIGVATHGPTMAPINPHHHDGADGFDTYATNSALTTVTILAVLSFLISIALVIYIIADKCCCDEEEDNSSRAQQTDPTSPSIQMGGTTNASATTGRI